VSGLFDPEEDVIVRAIVATERREVKGDAVAVTRRRMRDLYTSGSREVRRQVVIAARENADLALDEIVASAHNDRAWSVRREGAPPATSKGEPSGVA
jgi:hypothetical protein